MLALCARRLPLAVLLVLVVRMLVLLVLLLLLLVLMMLLVILVLLVLLRLGLGLMMLLRSLLRSPDWGRALRLDRRRCGNRVAQR